MATSSLDPRVVPIPDREIGKGHGTSSLGPSDTSDSGSDVRGGTGLQHETGIGLESGTASDRDRSRARGTAGPDIGDANLDSDSDAAGTGEHASAGRDTSIESGRDIDTDRVESIGRMAEAGQIGEESPAEETPRDSGGKRGRR